MNKMKGYTRERKVMEEEGLTDCKESVETERAKCSSSVITLEGEFLEGERHKS